MKNNTEKLREILCEVPEIEKDLMKLKFGTFISTPKGITRVVQIKKDFCTDENNYATLLKSIHIIGNPIQERHLEIYCQTKCIEICITPNYIALGRKIEFDGIKPIVKIRRNCRKDLEDQDPQVIEKLVKFLIDNK